MTSPFAGQILMAWTVKNCVTGAPNEEAARQQLIRIILEGGLRSMAIKVADGNVKFNQRNTALIGYKWVDDILPGIYQLFEKLNLTRLGWHYIYGYSPLAEAEIAHTRIQELGLQGYIIDPEIEYKKNYFAAPVFMKRFRELEPDIPLALCSYRYPNVHPEFPWAGFLNPMVKGRDVHMPQVYHQADFRTDGLAQQVRTSYAQLMAKKQLDFVPTFPLYQAGTWKPTEAQLNQGKDAAKTLGCLGLAYYALDDALNKLDAFQPTFNTTIGYWDAIARNAEQWNPAPPVPPQPPEPPLSVEARLTALEARVSALENLP